MQVLQNPRNVFHRNARVVKRQCRHFFDTREMTSVELIMSFTNQLKMQGFAQESLCVAIHSKKMKMAIVDGMPAQFVSISTAVDVMGETRELSSLDKKNYAAWWTAAPQDPPNDRHIERALVGMPFNAGFTHNCQIPIRLRFQRRDHREAKWWGYEWASFCIIVILYIPRWTSRWKRLSRSVVPAEWLSKYRNWWVQWRPG